MLVGENKGEIRSSPDCHAGGREFESRRPRSNIIKSFGENLKLFSSS